MKTIRELIDIITRHVVVEQGEQNGWKYRKWSNGFAECWYTTFGRASVNYQAWGNQYYADIDGIDFPFEFVEVKSFFTPYGAQSWPIGNYGASETNTGKIRFASNAGGSHQAYCHIYAVGKWK